MNKFIGSIMITIGTAIGAGMLALPMVSCNSGFFTTFILTIFIWLLMTLTGFLILEISLAFPLYKNNFATMAQATLGTTGKIITLITYLILLYAVTGAYISGNASLLSMLLNHYCHILVPNWMNAVLFTLVLGGIIFWSTRAVDCLNRALLGTKCVFLFLTLFLLLPYVKISLLINPHHEFSSIFMALPIFVCAFCYHMVIPSLINYNGKNVNILKKIIFCGTTITLLIYCFWLCVTLGIIPLKGVNSFATINNNHNDVGNFIEILTHIINKPLISMGIDAFANIAMTTSFLGVGLSLFDFLADSCKRQNNLSGRLQTSILAFLPPLVFAIFYPQGFVLALNYAAIFIIMLCVILPAVMVLKSRYKNKHNIKHIELAKNHLIYKVKINTIALFIILAIGIALITLQIIYLLT